MKLSPRQLAALRFLGAVPNCYHYWLSINAGILVQLPDETKVNGRVTAQSLVRLLLATESNVRGYRYAITEAGLRVLAELEAE